MARRAGGRCRAAAGRADARGRTHGFPRHPAVRQRRALSGKLLQPSSGHARRIRHAQHLIDNIGNKRWLDARAADAFNYRDERRHRGDLGDHWPLYSQPGLRDAADGCRPAKSGTRSISSTTSGINDGSTRGRPMPSILLPIGLRRLGASTGTNMWGVLQLAARMREEGRTGSLVTLLCAASHRQHRE
jgi:hypothetical protein